MSLIKLAATKWKTMVSELSPSSYKKLSHLIPDKKKYIQGLETGLIKRQAALEKKHSIDITTRYMNSKTFDPNTLFGESGLPKIKIPLPNASVSLDSKHFMAVGPRSPFSSAANLMTGNKKDRFAAKVINLNSRNHELTEISHMARAIKDKPQVNIDSKLITKIKRKGLNHLTNEEAAKLNPHLLEPKYHSHMHKNVVNTDFNFAKKTPFPHIGRRIKEFRELEKTME